MLLGHININKIYYLLPKEDFFGFLFFLKEIDEKAGKKNKILSMRNFFGLKCLYVIL